LAKLFKILGEGRLFEEVISYPLAGFVFVGVDGTGTGAWFVIILSTIVSIKKIALKLNKKILEVALALTNVNTTVFNVASLLPVANVLVVVDASSLFVANVLTNQVSTLIFFLFWPE